MYKRVWRWHFYAGVIVAPFLMILSITGAIYLFNNEIDDWLYPQQRFVADVQPALPPSLLVGAAVNHFPGSSARRLYNPIEPGRSATVFITTAAGEEKRVYVDPGTAQVLGSFIYTNTLVGFADVFHGSLLIGSIGDNIVELMACWSFILLLTGLYLWWPREPGQWLKLMFPTFLVKGREAWRVWHGVIGFWSAIILGFLILTGLPWAGVWGDMFRAVSNTADIGYPANYRLHGGSTVNTESNSHKAQLGSVPWTLEQSPMPVSDDHALHHASKNGVIMYSLRNGIGIDGAATRLQEMGLDPAYRLFLPTDPQGVYTAYTYPARPQGQRTIHLDQYSGKVLGDVRYEDYGIAAKGVELGVQLHMGNYFGRANQLLMLVGCLGGIAMAISGPVMWWKRRPKGRLAAPRRVSSRKMKSITWLIILMGILLPLAGVSMLLVLLIDWLWLRRSNLAAT